MKTKLLSFLFIFSIFVEPIFSQLHNYAIKYGIQGQILIPNTEFPSNAYMLSLYGRGFLKSEIASSLEAEIGVGFGNLSSEDFTKQKWESNIIPLDFRINFSPFTSEVYSPYVYSGLGLLRWYVTNLPTNATNKESGWNLEIPVGGGIEFNINDAVLFDVSAGYAFTTTDNLNNYTNHKNKDGYYYFGFGFTFVDGSDLTDKDKDGLIKKVEEEIGTNSNLYDTDGDHLSDGEEKLTYNTNPLNKDTDFDGLNDFEEVKTYLTDPNSSDSDGDNLSDFQEIFTYKTNPNSKDTDQDELTDGYEVNKYKTNPNSNDSDHDGLLDKEEIFETKTDPNRNDTDGDGIPDGVEVKTLKTNPLDKNDPAKNTYKEYYKSESKDSDTSNSDFQNKLNSNEPIILAGINFVLESSEINSSSEKMLNQTLEALKHDPNLKIEVRGYTDNTGSEKYNLKLSKDRAQVVKEWFVKHGIDFRRIKAVGFGELHPIYDNNTKIGRAKNRRIEIIKIK